MGINNVSFGGVVAVWGTGRNMNKFNEAIKKYPNFEYAKDNVTSCYMYASKNGLMARAAQSGKTVDVFITGKDLENKRQGKDGWGPYDDMLSNLTRFINLDREKSMDDAARKLTKDYL